MLLDIGIQRDGHHLRDNEVAPGIQIALSTASARRATTRFRSERNGHFSPSGVSRTRNSFKERFHRAHEQEHSIWAQCAEVVSL